MGSAYGLTAALGEDEESAPVVRVYPNSVAFAPIIFDDPEFEENPTLDECE